MALRNILEKDHPHMLVNNDKDGRDALKSDLSRLYHYFGLSQRP